MKPILLLLSGPPGIGKSTLAQRYADDHPMALALDIDVVWRMMGQWQQEYTKSMVQKMNLAAKMAEVHLREGHNVVIAQDLSSQEQFLLFESVACESNALFIEVLLTAPLKESIKRCIRRGRAMGYKTGFRPGGILDTNGREKKLAAMYQEMMTASKTRPNLHRVRSRDGYPEVTYKEILRIVDAESDVSLN